MEFYSLFFYTTKLFIIINYFFVFLTRCHIYEKLSNRLALSTEQWLLKSKQNTLHSNVLLLLLLQLFKPRTKTILEYNNELLNITLNKLKPKNKTIPNNLAEISCYCFLYSLSGYLFSKSE